MTVNRTAVVEFPSKEAIFSIVSEHPDLRLRDLVEFLPKVYRTDRINLSYYNNRLRGLARCNVLHPYNDDQGHTHWRA